MSRIDYLEGRRNAAALLHSAAFMPRAFYEKDGPTQVLLNMKRTAESRPEDYAKGVMEVVERAPSNVDIYLHIVTGKRWAVQQVISGAVLLRDISGAQIIKSQKELDGDVWRRL